MSDVTITHNGSAALIARFTAAISDAVGDEAEDALKDWRDLLAEPKHGQTYGSHVASAPGEAPANETMTLSNSLEINRQGAFAATIEATGEGLTELEYLEGGTSRMAPRPSVERIQDEVDKRFKKRLQKATQKALK